MIKLKPSTLAIILAGGRVDDLNVLTAYRPKSAVPFGGFARVVDFPLSNLMQSGLDQVAILSQYRSYSLINHVGVGAAWDMIGRYRGISILPPYQGFGQSSWYRGTADAVFQNLDFIQYHSPENLLIISGDHVYHMDYREIIQYHKEKDADLTMACVNVPLDKAQRFGLADIDDEDGERGGRIHQYREKPASPTSNWASMTVYCFKAQTLYDVLDVNAREDDSFEFGKDIIPRLMAAQCRIYGFKFSGYWGYTRTIEEYWQAHMDLLGNEPRIDLEKWGLRTNLEHRGIRDHQPLRVGNSANIQNSLVHNGCVIEGEVVNSILFPGVHIKPGAVVKNSVLFFNNVVGRDAVVDKAIIDVNVSIGARARIGDDGPVDRKKVTVIGWNNHLPDGMLIGSDCTLYPGLKPEKMLPVLKTGEVLQ